jgi:hypothetical protein
MSLLTRPKTAGFFVPKLHRPRTLRRDECHRPNEKIAAMIEAGDDTLNVGVADRDSEAVETENASPRAWGFDVEEINRSYALAIWGGKAVVVNEQPSGPVNDRVRVMSFEIRGLRTGTPKSSGPTARLGR